MITMKSISQLLIIAFSISSAIVLNYLYSPDSLVWNNNVYAINKISPYLHQVLLSRYLVLTFLALCCSVFVYLRSNTSRILLISGAVLGGYVLCSYTEANLQTCYYFIWKYESVTEEIGSQSGSIVNPTTLPLFIRDLTSNSESLDVRCRIALALGQANAKGSLKAMREIVKDGNQNKYLKFNCLKSIRLMSENEFQSIAEQHENDSSMYLYKKYEN